MRGSNVKKITSEELQQILKYREEGLPLKEIARRMGLSPSYVRYVLCNKERYMARLGVFHLLKEISNYDYEEEEEGPSMFFKLRLELNYTDYSRWEEIKNELRNKLKCEEDGLQITDNYVAYYLLQSYCKMKELEEENRILRKMLSTYTYYL